MKVIPPPARHYPLTTIHVVLFTTLIGLELAHVVRFF